MNTRKAIALLQLFALGCGTLGGAPAYAEDEKTVGILAGLGVVAASGKTTLGAGAGAIEAGLLGVDNFQQAGRVIAGIVNGLRSGQDVLVLTHDEKVDLASWRLLVDRIGQVRTLVNACKPAPKTPTLRSDDGRYVAARKLFPGSKLLGSDFVGAGLTDVGIGAITLTAEDRLLVAGLLMNAGDGTLEANNSWTLASGYGSGTSAKYRIASDFVGLPIENGVIKQPGKVKATYDDLIIALDEKRGVCAETDAGKSTLTIADGLVNGLNAAGATGIPLLNAIQLEQAARDAPAVLRLAIEQVGGTSIARTGILYTFGKPNAATVASGLLVSFRLSDPTNGSLRAWGLVRCMMGQSNLKRVTDIMKRDGKRSDELSKPDYAIGESVCDYKVWTPPSVKPAG